MDKGRLATAGSKGALALTPAGPRVPASAAARLGGVGPQPLQHGGEARVAEFPAEEAVKDKPVFEGCVSHLMRLQRYRQ